MQLKDAVLLILLVIVPSLSSGAAKTPTVTIRLAPEIHSETVNIVYYLYGTFGAVGAVTTPMKNVHSYQIEAVHDGGPATSIKAVIYASGCELDTVETDFSEEAPIEKTYECTPLPTASLVGHIPRSRIFRKRDFEVVVTYLGFWECKFFELSDCQVPQIELARAPVNENGEFEATIVDFSPEQTRPMRHHAELWLVLRDAKTWNPVGEGLRPTREFRTRSVAGLAIRPFYPPPLEFEVVPTSNSIPRPPNAGQ